MIPNYIEMFEEENDGQLIMAGAGCKPQDPDEVMQNPESPVSAVDHPSHYNSGKIEVIDYIEDQNLDFCLGNAVKYISRAGKKNPDKEIEDLEKAIWYIQRHILRKLDKNN